MFGVILVSIGSFFSEMFAVIGKREVQKREEGIYTMGFLMFFWGVIFFFALILFKGSFDFSLASIPTFSIRVIFEMILVTVALKATVQVERSAFGFVRTLTLPLLLAVDLFIGYSISSTQMIGIGLIILTMIILFMNHGIKKKGLKLLVWSAIIPVITISLFKYNITYFNSVEAEQFMLQSILLVYLFFMAIKFDKENPLRFLKKSIFIKQSLYEGIGTVITSFAYIFAPASIIASAKRSSSVLWAVLSGNKVFHEKHFILKILMFILLAGGIVLLVI